MTLAEHFLDGINHIISIKSIISRNEFASSVVTQNEGSSKDKCEFVEINKKIKMFRHFNAMSIQNHNDSNCLSLKL